MYRLINRVQNYEWGSATAIPELLGVAPDGRPVAEVWMGAHASAPSALAAPDGAPVPGVATLLDLVRRDPAAALGERVHDAFGPRLPFLLKLLAAARPLSLQVHPHPDAAREGCAREDALGVDRAAAERSFRDDQHKPEMVLALTRFEGLSGFRDPERTAAVLEGLDGDLVGRIRDLLILDPSPGGLESAFSTILQAREQDVAADIARTVESCRRRLEQGSPYPVADETVTLLARWYPGDPGAIASLLLNRLSLEPGEAAFVPAGVVHAYLEGTAVEIMASSDNVLRAGLTAKHVDVQALIDCTDYTPGDPPRPRERRSGRVTELLPPVAEFGLLTVRCAEAPEGSLPAEGPRIVLAVEGAVRVAAGGGVVDLARGESVFVAHGDGPLELSVPEEGDRGTAVLAFVP